MSSSDNSVAALSSTYLNSLVDYVLEVKPFRTKINTRSGAIAESYLFSDEIDVKIRALALKETIFLGADTVERSTIKVLTQAEKDLYGMNGFSRPISNSWQQQIISDGQRLTWPIANVSIPKFASNASISSFVSGPQTILHNPNDGVAPIIKLDDYQGIVGLTRGVFDQKRWDGLGITSVTRNGIHQQDSVDYYLSHGVFSFDTFAPVNVGDTPKWMPHNINQVPAALPAFSSDVASLYYNDVIRTFGTITSITGGNYEEWSIEIVSLVDTVSVTVRITGYQNGAVSSLPANHTFDWPSATKQPYVGANVSFYYEQNPQPLDATVPEVGGTWTLTPGSKITVADSAQSETWSLIKTNPNVFVAGGKPTFVAGVARAEEPSIEIHTAAMVRTQPLAGDEIPWTLNFTDGKTCVLDCFGLLPGYPKTISLLDGCSYRNSDIGFTLIPNSQGWFAGDSFSWTTRKPSHYKVFGSLSGWQEDATVGEWYWNGKVGFKIPKLDYYAATVISTGDDWETIVDTASQFSALAPVSAMAEPSVYRITFTEGTSNVINFHYTLSTASRTVSGIDDSNNTLKVADTDAALLVVQVDGVPTTNFTCANSQLKFQNILPIGTIVTVTAPPFKGSATVFNDQYGQCQSLQADTNWADEYVSFRLDTIPGVLEFSEGDTLDVFISPSFTFINESKNVSVPYLLNTEIFPLQHSHGAVIFPVISQGDKVTIDKAFIDKVFFKIKNAALYHPELGADGDSIPLIFKHFDRLANGLPSSAAEFSDLVTYIQAFSAATNQLVFSITSPRFEKTNRTAQSTLTFNKAFVDKYLPFNTQYSINVFPDAAYGQHINVKVVENLKVYERIKIKVFDPIIVSIDDEIDWFHGAGTAVYFGEGPATGYWRYEIVNILSEGPWIYELVYVTPQDNPDDQAWDYPFSVSILEGGALLMDDYDTDGYDDGGYDESTLTMLAGNNPAITINDTVVSGRVNEADLQSTPTLERAATQFGEGLTILQTTITADSAYDEWDYDTDEYDLSGSPEQVPGYKMLGAIFNFNIAQPLGTVVPTTAPGLSLTVTADEYKITMQNKPASLTGTWVIAPESNLADTHSGPVAYITSADETVTDFTTFRFVLPVGVNVPFRLWII